MAARWCSICKSYHESRSSSVCYQRARGHGRGPFRYPRLGALLAAPFYGILATAPIGWLTDGNPLSLVIFAVVTPLAAWWKWPKRSPQAREEAKDSQQAATAADANADEEPGAPAGKGRWRWVRRALLVVAALPLLVGLGLVIHDVDLLRYPARYEDFAGRYFGLLTDPFGDHPKKTTARLTHTSWQGVVVDEVREGGGWKALRRTAVRGKGLVVLPAFGPAERGPATADPPRRRRLLQGKAAFHFSARGFSEPITTHQITLLRESDRQWLLLTLPRYFEPAETMSRVYSKALLAPLTRALARPSKAYVQVRPWVDVEVFVDDATFAKIARLPAR